jgi:hypothetical protein
MHGGEHKHGRTAGNQSPPKGAASAMRQVRKERADDRKLRDVLGWHGSESVSARRARAREVRATVAAEVARGHDPVAVRASDERWSFPRPSTRFAGAALGALAPIGASFSHPPPLFM